MALTTTGSILQQRRIGVGFMSWYPVQRQLCQKVTPIPNVSANENICAAGGQVTMAYYPDTRQEKILSVLGFSDHIDLFFSMSYDRVPGKHSTLKLAKETVRNWDAEGLPRRKLCLGLPFYARHIETGEAKTYEEIHRTHKPLIPSRCSIWKIFMSITLLLYFRVQWGRKILLQRS